MLAAVLYCNVLFPLNKIGQPCQSNHIITCLRARLSSQAHFAFSVGSLGRLGWATTVLWGFSAQARLCLPSHSNRHIPQVADPPPLTVMTVGQTYSNRRIQKNVTTDARFSLIHASK